MTAYEGSRELAWIRDRMRAPLPIPDDSAVIATNLEGQVAYWDPAAERLYGWTSDEAVGRNIVDITPSSQTRDEAALIMEALQAGRGWAGEIGLRKRNGAPLRAFVLDVPVGDWSARQGAIVGISAPIAFRERVERHAASMEAAVRARFAHVRA